MDLDSSRMIYTINNNNNTALEERNNQNPSPRTIHSLLADCFNEIFNITDDHDHDHDHVVEEDVINDFNNQYKVVKEPALCPDLSAEIFENLRLIEMETRPQINYMDKVVQGLDDIISPLERRKCVDFLVHVANDYGFVLDQESLHLAINYLDRYLSTKQVMIESELKFVGLTCLMIAIKYQDEICVPRLDDYVYLTQNKYSAKEFIQMEYSILSDLKFKVATPTAWCFLGRYLMAARDQFRGLFADLENMARYITWLSLFSYSMQCFRPSMVAASSVFLAKYIIVHGRRPWSATLAEYTKYQPAHLRECVLALYTLGCMNRNSDMPTIREKYARLVYEYGCIGFERCPPSIPLEYFQDQF